MMVIPSLISTFGTVTKGLIKGLEVFVKKRTSRDHPNYIIMKIGQNTEKSPGDLLSLKLPRKIID